MDSGNNPELDNSIFACINTVRKNPLVYVEKLKAMLGKFEGKVL